MSTASRVKVGTGRRMRVKSAGVLMLALAVVTTACSSSNDEVGESAVDTSAPLYEELPEHVKSNGYISDIILNHPPYQVVATDGQVSGVTPELEAAMSKYLGVPFRTMVGTGNLSALLGAITAGRADLYAGPVVDSLEREAAGFDIMNFIRVGASLMANTGKFNASDPSSVCGATVFHAATSTHMEKIAAGISAFCVAQGKQAMNVGTVESTNDLLLALDSGRADVVLNAADQVLAISNDNPDKYEGIPLTEEQGNDLHNEGMVMLRSSELGPVLLKAMEEIQKDGSYDRIMTDAGLAEVMTPASLNNPGVS